MSSTHFEESAAKRILQADKKRRIDLKMKIIFMLLV